jgi:hypothetical protein
MYIDRYTTVFEAHFLLPHELRVCHSAKNDQRRSRESYQSPIYRNKAKHPNTQNESHHQIRKVHILGIRQQLRP